MKAKDIMTTDIISVSPKTKVSEVARLISEHSFNGVPVMENGELLGMITESDFLTRDFERVHIPSLIKIFSDLKISKYLPEKREDFNNIISADAQSIMTTDFISVSPETHIAELTRIFREKDVNPIPVIDENKKLVGIVSKADILNLIGKLREEDIDFLTENEK